MSNEHAHLKPERSVVTRCRYATCTNCDQPMILPIVVNGSTSERKSPYISLVTGAPAACLIDTVRLVT